jgi:serine/threonine protein kinase
MGVTYKALDVDLRCPVTLKVISERYLGDESARLRFLREARAATSVRHPNIASVFHCRQKIVLERKAWSVEEFGKTILFSNRMFLGSTGKVPNGALASLFVRFLLRARFEAVL